MKINLRKGLFETSSSSEDSLSVYQDMKLYILPKDIYNRFINGEVYIRFGENIRPDWSDDENAIEEANKEPVKKYNLASSTPGYKFAVGHLYYYFDKFYIDYKSYTGELYYHFSDYQLFNYEDGDNMIFGFYAYTED